MKYRDYLNLKLQNFSKEELINFSINFAKDTTGYLPRKTENLTSDKQDNKNGNKNENKSSSTKNEKSGKAWADSLNHLQSKDYKGSFDEKSHLSSSSSKSKAGTSPSNNGEKKIEQKPSTETKVESKVETKVETKPEQSSSNSNESKSDSNKSETKTVKNYYGQDVTFEKRSDGKWYHKDSGKVVDKKGSYRSYFDAENGVKDVAKSTSKSKPESTSNTNTSKSNQPANSNRNDKTGTKSSTKPSSNSKGPKAKMSSSTAINIQNAKQKLHFALFEGKITQEQYDESIRRIDEMAKENFY